MPHFWQNRQEYTHNAVKLSGLPAWLTGKAVRLQRLKG